MTNDNFNWRQISNFGDMDIHYGGRYFQIINLLSLGWSVEQFDSNTFQTLGTFNSRAQARAYIQELIESTSYKVKLSTVSDIPSKCESCGRRFGEMDDEPVECETCEYWTCPDCPCGCKENKNVE